MEDLKIISVIFCICMIVTVVSAGDYCSYYNDDYWGSTDYMWCNYGCCGDMYNRYCCEYSAVGAIVGIVIGSVCGLVLLVSVIVAICCCCRKSRGRAGQVCQPNLATQPAQNLAYGVPGTTVTYGAPVGYNNMGFVQTTTMTTGTAIPQQPMQPNPYAQPPPKYEELNVPPQQPQPN